MTQTAQRPQQISPAFLDELRGRANLPAMVGRGVQLRRSGKCWTGLCPFHGERRPSFAVYANGYHCFGCGVSGDAIEWIVQEQRVSFLEAVTLLAVSVGLEPPTSRMIKADRPPLASVPPPGPAQTDREREIGQASAKAIWLQAAPSLRDTPAEAYLLARRIDLRRLERQPRALRFAPALWCAEANRRFPAMVAAISDGAGVHVATHRTWLDQDRNGWRKASLDKPKKVRGSMSGGSIRLARGQSGKPLADMPADEMPAIGEGIETCLTVALACPELRVLAGVSLGGMGMIELPEQASRVLLLADNDSKPAAIAAFQRVVNHHLAVGRDVRIARSNYGGDFNDAVRTC